MLFKNVIKNTVSRLKKQALHQNKTAAKVASEKCGIERIRNIGILAHIDAGLYLFIIKPLLQIDFINYIFFFYKYLNQLTCLVYQFFLPEVRSSE